MYETHDGRSTQVGRPSARPAGTDDHCFSAYLRELLEIHRFGERVTETGLAKTRCRAQEAQLASPVSVLANTRRCDMSDEVLGLSATAHPSEAPES